MTPTRPRTRALRFALALPLTLGLLAPTAAWSAPDHRPGEEYVHGQVSAGSMTDPVYSITNGNGNTLLTTSVEEARNAQRNLGWSGQIGEVFRASRTPKPGTVPVYRMYHSSTATFLYTASPGEKDRAEDRYGFRAEKVAFYVPNRDVGGSVQVHRMHKVVRGVWRYRDVAGADGRAEAEADGWKFDATTYRGMPAPLHGTAEPRPAPEPAPTQEARPAPAPTPALAPQHEFEGDGRFTIAQFNDTQADVFHDGQRQLPARVDWILDNVQREDIRFAVHTGDLVNWWDSARGNDQYHRADRWLQPLNDSAIPFAMAVGNHDTLAVADGEGHDNRDETGRSLAAWGLRETQLVNQILPASDFRNMRGQMEPGKFDNSFHTFTAEGADFLVLSLELWPRPQALNWAERVVRDHPRHNVIVLTHHYLYGDGRIAEDNGGYGHQPVSAIRDRIVLKYPNVKVVLSGHVGWTSSRVDANPGGNVVSIMTNMSPTDDGPLRLLRIDVPGGRLDSEVVSTIGGRRGQHPVSARIDWIR